MNHSEAARLAESAHTYRDHCFDRSDGDYFADLAMARVAPRENARWKVP